MSKKDKAITALPYSISQNYLTSAKTIRKILLRTTITNCDHVIEIGAGKGHITKELLKICRLVEAYEIDGKLYRDLQQKLGHIENLTLKHQDFLKAPLPSGRPYKVFSNIPFSITTKIMNKLISAAQPPEEIWLTMEAGAVKRFLGKPLETHASLSIKPFFHLEIVHHFLRTDFHPMPSVPVSLLHLTRKEPTDMPLSQQKAFLAFVENSLRHGIRRYLTKKQVSTALKQAGLPCIPATGEVLYVQWLCLFRCYLRFKA